MKKCLYIVMLSVLLGGMSCSGVSQSDTKSAESAKVVPTFALDIDNLDELSKCKIFSERTKKMIAGALEVIRGLNKKEDSIGSVSDIKAAQSYLVPVLTLQKRLKEANNSEKFLEFQEGSEDLKSEIKELNELKQKVNGIDSLQKVIELPMKQEISNKIKDYIKILMSIDQATTLKRSYKIIGIPQAFIDTTRAEHELVEHVRSISTLEELKEFYKDNHELLSEINVLEMDHDYISHKAVDIKSIIDMPNLNTAGRLAVSRLQTERDVLNEQVSNLSEKLQVLSSRFDRAAETVRNEYHFRMIITSLLISAAYGFDFTKSNHFDEVSDRYNNSMAKHALSWLPKSAGVKKDQWRNAIEDIASMLQLTLSTDDFSEYLGVLQKLHGQALNCIKNVDDGKALYIQDSLRQLSQVLNRFNVELDPYTLDDFNDRKDIAMKHLIAMQTELKKKQKMEESKGVKKKTTSTANAKPAIENGKSSVTGDKKTVKAPVSAEGKPAAEGDKPTTESDKTKAEGEKLSAETESDQSATEGDRSTTESDNPSTDENSTAEDKKPAA